MNGIVPPPESSRTENHITAPVTMTTRNEMLAAALQAEGDAADGYRQIALLTSARIIRNFPVEITDASQLRGVAGVGTGTLRRVTELLRTPVTTLSLAVAPMTPPTAPAPVTAPDHPAADGAIPYDFTRFPFIGPATATYLHRRGITTLQQLEEGVATGRVSLTGNQRAGLRYHTELAQRIPREEVAEIGYEVLRHARDLGMAGAIAGSYRRRLPTSGDVDVLVTGPVNRLAELVERLRQDRIEYVFSRGPVKFMGVAVGPLSGVRRALDIRYVEPAVWGTALLFATGPYEFNIYQRQRALERGMRLNEYGLVREEDGTRLATQREEDVFYWLDMAYLPPEARQ